MKADEYRALAEAARQRAGDPGSKWRHEPGAEYWLGKARLFDDLADDAEIEAEAAAAREEDR